MSCMMLFCTMLFSMMPVYCITAPVQDLILSKDNCTTNCVSATPPSLSFVENEPSLLQCVATGGIPPPELKIYKEDFDITYRFKTATYTRLMGEYGLRIMHSSVHTYTNYLILDSQDDGRTLRCTATVPGLKSNVTSSTMHVLCKLSIIFKLCRLAQNEYTCNIFYILKNVIFFTNGPLFRLAISGQFI